MVCARVIFALLATLAVASARPFHLDDAFSPATRQLLQVDVNQDCPAGCDKTGGGCVLDSTSGGYRCITCLGSLVVDTRSGKCMCPAGRYAGTDTCNDCTKGWYCQGGIYTGAGVPAQQQCSTDLTTLGRRATSIKACVNVPGTSYAVDTAGVPSATACPANTYGPGLRKQRQCVPCPTGYITAGPGSTSAAQCVVPAGYFLKGPGQVAPCPKGEYKIGNGAVAACSKCKEGVTTAAEASTAASDCNIVLPTYYPYTIDASGEITRTEKCPQKYWCAGGKPTAEFDPSAQTPVADATTTVALCAAGTWTEGVGSYTADQCLTPPGHYTANGETKKCANGEYRAEWRPAAEAGACDVCGDLIQSEETDQIIQYAITPDATETRVPVATTSAACYILAGQGMMYSPTDKKFRAVNCNSNNYGVANKTTGLAAFPCRACPAGMQTDKDSFPATGSQYWQKSDNFGTLAVEGFNDPKACVTLPGYGYNGRVATQCKAGSWNPAGTYGTCTQCAPGLTTSMVNTEQVNSTDCKLAEGYGWYDNMFVACPIGTYRTDMAADTTSTCTPCSDGLTTSRTGGRNADDCNMCKPGWGGDAQCSTKCGGSVATFGPSGRSTETSDSRACVTCPTMTVGFSFDFKSANQAFTPDSVAREGAESGADCLAEYAQIVDAAWWLPGADGTDFAGAEVAGITNFTACVADCTADCQMVTFDYNTNKCYKKVKGTVDTAGDVLAFKAVLGGDTTATSVKGKFLPSGSYSFWGETVTATGAGSLGKTQPTVVTGSLQACLAACDNDAGCAAVAMAGVNRNDDTITGCKKILGDTTTAAFVRSVTKAIVTKLEKTAALP